MVRFPCSIIFDLAHTRRGQGTDQIQRDIEHVYELFPVLRERQKQQARTLSGGQQQMVAIGRALMSGPKLIILDEPSLGLAPLVVRQIFATIKQLVSSGASVLLVEQNAVGALGIADRAYVMQAGRIVLQGTGAELLKEPEVIRSYLGAR